MKREHSLIQSITNRLVSLKKKLRSKVHWCMDTFNLTVFKQMFRFQTKEASLFRLLLPIMIFTTIILATIMYQPLKVNSFQNEIRSAVAISLFLGIWSIIISSTLISHVIQDSNSKRFLAQYYTKSVYLVWYITFHGTILGLLSILILFMFLPALKLHHVLFYVFLLSFLLFNMSIISVTSIVKMYFNAKTRLPVGKYLLLLGFLLLLDLSVILYLLKSNEESSVYLLIGSTFYFLLTLILYSLSFVVLHRVFTLFIFEEYYAPWSHNRGVAFSLSPFSHGQSYSDKQPFVNSSNNASYRVDEVVAIRDLSNEEHSLPRSNSFLVTQDQDYLHLYNRKKTSFYTNGLLSSYVELLKFFYRYLSKYGIILYVFSSGVALSLLGYFLPSNLNLITTITHLALVGIYYWSINAIMKGVPATWAWLQSRFQYEMKFFRAYTISLILLSLLLYSGIGIIIGLMLGIMMFLVHGFPSPFAFIGNYFSFMIFMKLLVLELNLGYIYLATNTYSYLRKTLSRNILSLIMILLIFISNQITVLIALSSLMSIFSVEVMIYEFRK